jgi:hypothetical protein
MTGETKLSEFPAVELEAVAESPSSVLCAGRDPRRGHGGGERERAQKEAARVRTERRDEHALTKGVI